MSVIRAAKGVLQILGAYAQPAKHRLRGLVYRATDVQMYDDYRDSNSDGWRLLAALIRRFKESCGDTPLMVVPLPTYHYYVDKLKPIYDRLFESLEDVERGLHVLSLTRSLVEGKGLSERLAYCFPNDGHYSPKGHAAVAEIMGVPDELVRRAIMEDYTTLQGDVNSKLKPPPELWPELRDLR